MMEISGYLITFGDGHKIQHTEMPGYSYLSTINDGKIGQMGSSAKKAVSFQKTIKYQYVTNER